MTLNEYQTKALETALFPQKGEFPGVMYLGLGMAGEAGEVADHCKKAFRDDGSEVLPERRKAMKAELGDVLWYVAVMTSELGMTLEEVARFNNDKLASRMKRGVLGGSGDNR